MNTAKKKSDLEAACIPLISETQKKYIHDHYRHHHLITILRFLVFFTFLIIWEAAGRFRLIDTFFFSSPSMVISYFVQMLADGSLFTHAGITLLETILSFLLITLIYINIFDTNTPKHNDNWCGIQEIFRDKYEI